MPDSLAGKSLNALKWSYIGTVVRAISQIVAQITIARILGPEPFGLIAAALFLVNIFGIFVELGLGSALIQSQQISAGNIRRTFTAAVTMGSLGTILLFAMADIAASIYNDARLTQVIQILSPVLFIQSLSVVSQALLKRELNFRVIQIVQVLSYVVGYAFIGIALAVLGFGVWSLIIATLSNALLMAIFLYVNVRHEIALEIPKREFGLRGYNGQVLACNAANWALENVDTLIVGRLLGTKALGLYSVAYNFARTPANHLMVSLQSVLFPAGARAQDNNLMLQEAYLAVISVVAMVAFPFFAGLAATSHTVVTALFGQQWAESAAILFPLAIAMVSHVAMTGSAILWARNQVGSEARVQITMLAIYVPAIYLASLVSLVAVSWTILIVSFTRAVLLIGVLLQSLDLSWRDFLRATRGGWAIAIVCFTVLYLIENHFASMQWSALIKLCIEIVVATALALTMTIVFRHQFLDATVTRSIRHLLRKK